MAKRKINECAKKEIEILETDSKKLSPYNPKFVKDILESDKRGDYKEVDPKDIWGSLGIKKPK